MFNIYYVLVTVLRVLHGFSSLCLRFIDSVQFLSPFCTWVTQSQNSSVGKLGFQPHNLCYSAPLYKLAFWVGMLPLIQSHYKLFPKEGFTDNWFGAPQQVFMGIFEVNTEYSSMHITLNNLSFSNDSTKNLLCFSHIDKVGMCPLSAEYLYIIIQSPFGRVRTAFMHSIWEIKV